MNQQIFIRTRIRSTEAFNLLLIVRLVVDFGHFLASSRSTYCTRAERDRERERQYRLQTSSTLNGLLSPPPIPSPSASVRPSIVRNRRKQAISHSRLSGQMVGPEKRPSLLHRSEFRWGCMLYKLSLKSRGRSSRSDGQIVDAQMQLFRPTWCKIMHPRSEWRVVESKHWAGLQLRQ